MTQSRPNHLVAVEGFYLPPLAQFVLALLLPTGSQQRAVHKVILELACGHSLPLPSIILVVEAVRAIGQKLQSVIPIVVCLITYQTLALP